MKFHWFHLMPYPDLPEDFREKYRSVWVDVPSHLYSFSFAPNPSWSSTFSPQAEILDYLRDFEKKNG